MSDCLFCQIVSGDIPAEVVARSDEAVAFRDINPQAPTHVLLIPTRHVASIDELGADDAADVMALFSLAQEVARAEGLGGGWRLVSNVGPDAGQSVFHLHFHLLGGRHLAWPPG